jgi:hypothetical protein
MKVISNKNTTRLVKGAVYDVLHLNNFNQTNYAHFRPHIVINLASNWVTLNPSNFTKLDGTPIDERNWSSTEYENNRSTDLSIKDVRFIKKGDLLVSRFSSKFFEKEKMYRVSEVFYEEFQKPGYNGVKYTQVNQKIKVDGYNRWISHYRFRLLDKQESRSVSLNNIFGEENPVSEDFKGRKIDRLEDKEKVILSTLLSSALDPYRNTLSTLDWTLQKKGKLYDLEYKDLEPFLDKKLSEIIKMID